MLFADFPGYQALKTRLCQMADGGRMHHGLLFAGQPGSPATLFALAFVQYVFCEDRQPGDSCGSCHSCRGMAKLTLADLHFLFPATLSDQGKFSEADITAKLIGPFRKFLAAHPFASRTEWAADYGAGNRQPIIRAADARELRERLSMKSFEGGYKIAFIWHPETMNTAAANILLKVLEEPPENTLFILASEEPDQLMPTIISRVATITVRPAEAEEMAEYLIGKQVPSALAYTAALASEGNIVLAESLAGEEELPFQTFFLRWMRACFSANVAEVMLLADEFAKMGREPVKALLGYGLSLYRQMLRHKVIGPNAASEPSLARFYDAMPTDAIEPMAKALENIHDLIERNVNAKMLFVVHSNQITQAIRAKRGG